MKSAWIRKIHLLAVLVLALSMFSGPANIQASEQAPAHRNDMGAMSRKLNDPTPDIWALQGEFDYIINKGDLRTALRILPHPLTYSFFIDAGRGGGHFSFLT